MRTVLLSAFVSAFLLASSCNNAKANESKNPIVQEGYNIYLYSSEACESQYQPCNNTIESGTNILYAKNNCQIKESKRIRWCSQFFKMSPDGSETTQITNEEGYKVHMMYYPKNKIYLYAVLKDGYAEIVSLSTNGNDEERLLTGFDKYDDYPLLSPDGKTLYFRRVGHDDYHKSMNDHEIWTLNIETRTEYQLTNNDNFEYNLRLSPDGKEILFLQSRGKENTYGFCRTKNISDNFIAYFDLETGRTGAVSDKGEKYTLFEISQNGRYIGACVDTGTNNDRFVLLDWEGNLLSEYSSEKNRSCEKIVFLEDSDKALFLSFNNSQYLPDEIIHILDIKTGIVTNSDIKGYAIYNFDIHPVTKQIYFIGKKKKTEGGMTTILYRTDLYGGNIEQLTDRFFSLRELNIW